MEIWNLHKYINRNRAIKKDKIDEKYDCTLAQFGSLSLSGFPETLKLSRVIYFKSATSHE